jgi:hypothetical protein
MIIGRGPGIRLTWVKTRRVKRKKNVDNGLTVMTYLGVVLVSHFSVLSKDVCMVFCFFWFGEHEDIGWAKRIGDYLWNMKKTRRLNTRHYRMNN